MSHIKQRRPGLTFRRHGFALPAVLAVVGVVTLIFLVAITASASLTSEANSARERVRFLQRAMSAEAKLSYLVMTEPKRPQGFMVNGALPILNDESGTPLIDGDQAQLVRFDNRPYLMDINGPMLVRLNDQAGMMNLAFLRGPPLYRLLSALGVPEAQHKQLEDRLIDYADMDTLSQPDGAEAEAYPNRWIPNRNLRYPEELLNVLGMREAADRRAWTRIMPLLTVDTTLAIFNVNTASPKSLELFLGITPDQAQTLVRERDIAPIQFTETVDTLLGTQLPWNSDFRYTDVGSGLILRLSDSQSAWTYRGRISLTPYRIDRPFWLDNVQMLEAPQRARADTSHAVRLPYAPY